MQLKYLTDEFAVSPQLQPHQLSELRAAGFTTVICNRPDGEQLDQPTIDSMRQQAEALGLSFHAIPMSGPTVDERMSGELAAILAKTQGKVVAYCRSGNRSSILWRSLQPAVI